MALDCFDNKFTKDVFLESKYITICLHFKNDIMILAKFKHGVDFLAKDKVLNFYTNTDYNPNKVAVSFKDSGVLKPLELGHMNCGVITAKLSVENFVNNTTQGLYMIHGFTKQWTKVYSISVYPKTQGKIITYQKSYKVNNLYCDAHQANTKTSPRKRKLNNYIEKYVNIVTQKAYHDSILQQKSKGKKEADKISRIM
ncbi:hypothetical protein QEN19_003435 [Hanseniaspora menglaensis]